MLVVCREEPQQLSGEKRREAAKDRLPSTGELALTRPQNRFFELYANFQRFLTFRQANYLDLFNKIMRTLNQFPFENMLAALSTNEKRLHFIKKTHVNAYA